MLLRMNQAIAAGIRDEMRADPALVVWGEDVAEAEGVFKASVGLREELVDRVRDTPISEMRGQYSGIAIAPLRSKISIGAAPRMTFPHGRSTARMSTPYSTSCPPNSMRLATRLARDPSTLRRIGSSDTPASDTAPYPRPGELDEWLERDLIPILGQRLVAVGALSGDDRGLLERDVSDRLDRAVEAVQVSPPPELAAMCSDVTAEAAG